MSSFPTEITSKRDMIGWAIDLAWPPGQPGQFVAVRIMDFEENHPSLEGWRGPEQPSEDYPWKGLEPIECTTGWSIDSEGFWVCDSWEKA